MDLATEAFTDLSGVAQLAQMHAKARKARQDADKAAAALKKVEQNLERQITNLLGSTNIGRINGETVIEWTRDDRFAHARFAEEEPDLARQFMVRRTKEELDVELVRRMRPDIWARYQTRRLLNTWDV